MWTLESVKNFHFNGVLLSKLYSLSWKSTEKLPFMKLKRDTKFGEESVCRLNIGIRNLTYWANYIFFELKKYRGVIFHETEEEFKIWREIDLSCQNWHKEFDKFWCEHLKVSKIFTLIRSFWANYIFFVLKMYGEVIFDKTEEGYKIWRGIGLSFQN